MHHLLKVWMVGALLLLAGSAVWLGYLRPVFTGDMPVNESFDFGPVSVRLYSLCLLAGVFAGLLLARRSARSRGIDCGHLDNIAVLCVISGLIGARVHHIISAWEYYSVQPLEMLALWHGGLGWYGGLIGAASALVLYSRKHGLPWLKLADILAPSVALGQSVGRWGNFFNQEAYGLPTELPWKMFVDYAHRLHAYAESEYYHPIFLYESLWNLMLTIVLLLLARKPLPEGRIFAAYLFGAGFGRILIEGIRIDQTIAFGIPANQALATVAVALGAAMLLRTNRKEKLRSSI